MTDDYKKTLLNYITDIEVGQPSTEEVITSNVEIPASDWTDFVPSFYQLKITGMIKSKTSDKIVLYGGYVEQGGTYQSNSRGIIIITDQDLNPIKTIYKFSSGTNLRPICSMYQDEEGQFVAVDSVIHPQITGPQEVRQALTSCEKRFIMLNDISNPINDEFLVNLRRSYIFGAGYINFICKNIFKNPSTSHYSFTGIKMSYGSGGYQPNASKIINLKINVGSANDWNKAETDDGFIYGGANVYYDSSDNANWKFLITYNVGNRAVYGWEGQNGTITGSTVMFDPAYSTIIDTVGINNQVAFTSNTKAYFISNNQYWGISGTPDAKYIGLFEADFSNHTVKEKFIKYIGSYDYCDLYNMFLQVVNGELYVQWCDNIANHKADYYIQRFTGLWNPILVKEQGVYYGSYRMFYVSQTFNLLKYNLIPTWLNLGGWMMQQITEIYNIANYNGTSYIGYNSLKPEYVNVYSNNEIVFSRNLNNLSITNNYIVASVEIPNTYLNGIELNPKDLVGETNTVLVEDGNTITKNIYEVLYLNYLNTINVIDNDNSLKTSTARYINTNVNTGTLVNQTNTKCDKLQINYSDNTSKIQPIGWDRIDDTHKSCEFTLYIDKAISSIDFISNDETTTYITIMQDLEVGKYYTFKQYLKVE